MAEPKRVAVLGAALLLAGCAQIPTSGAPDPVAEPAAEPAAAEVRVVAEGPRPGESVNAIVSGFLEASGTVEENFATAREYLTPAASAQWDPGSHISIYDHTGAALSERANNSVVLTAPADGTVVRGGVFSPTDPDEKLVGVFGLVRVGEQWRINALPAGLYISRQDFAREYQRINPYFIVRPPRSSVLVPDPVYVPQSPDLVAARMNALMRGPSRWLSSAVLSHVPSVLAAPVVVDSGLAQVQLKPESVPKDGVERDLMLAQLVMTLTEDPDILAVEVGAGGGSLTIGDAGAPQLRRADVTPYLPADLRPPPPSAYFLRDGSTFVLGESIGRAPFAPELELAEVAISPGRSMLAGISADRTRLWTGQKDEPRRLTVRARAENLRSASFDGDGNLWVLSGSAKKTVLRRYPPTGAPTRVELVGFTAGQIDRLRVAADGIRVAMVLEQAGGSEVYLALVEEGGSTVAVGRLRRVAPGLTDPTDVDWAAPAQLAVLAAERNAPPQAFGVGLGGEIVDLAPPLPDIASFAIAPGRPMVATTSADRIWRLRAGGTWFREGAGTAPAYPG